MFLDIHELEIHKIEFKDTLAPGRIDFGEDMRQVEPLEIEGTAELLDTEIRVTGHLKTLMESACDRCLEPSRMKADTDFDLFYRSAATIPGGEDVEISISELDVGFYQGDGLLLEDVIKEQVLLALPMKNLCKPDCLGLCLVCGKNRNLGDCVCTPPPKDDRWAALQKLKQ
jgi:uncharacterized protein